MGIFGLENQLLFVWTMWWPLAPCCCLEVGISLRHVCGGLCWPLAPCCCLEVDISLWHVWGGGLWWPLAPCCCLEVGISLWHVWGGLWWPLAPCCCLEVGISLCHVCWGIMVAFGPLLLSGGRYLSMPRVWGIMLAFGPLLLFGGRYLSMTHVLGDYGGLWPLVVVWRSVSLYATCVGGLWWLLALCCCLEVGISLIVSWCRWSWNHCRFQCLNCFFRIVFFFSSPWIMSLSKRALPLLYTFMPEGCAHVCRQWSGGHLQFLTTKIFQIWQYLSSWFLEKNISNTVLL